MAFSTAVVVANRLAFNQGARVFQGLADFFAAGHFAQAGVARRVGQDDDVAGEKGPWAPLRFISMPSWPATGITCMRVITGV
jgi:hypothetical protein